MSSSPASWGSSRSSSSTRFYCKLTKSMATAKTSPADNEDKVFLSGTAVREMLGRGERPPEEFSRPEVADVLIEAYAESEPTPA